MSCVRGDYGKPKKISGSEKATQAGSSKCAEISNRAFARQLGFIDEGYAESF